MNDKVILAAVILLLLIFRKSKKGVVIASPLVTAYKAPEGVYFAVQINDNWYQVSASNSEQTEVGAFTLKAQPTPNGNFSLSVEAMGDVSVYYANSNGEII